MPDFDNENSVTTNIPNLPGYTRKRNTSPTKKSAFSYIGGLIFMKDETVPKIESLVDRSVLTIGNTTSSSIPKPTDPKLKKEYMSIESSGIILTFNCYFEESPTFDADPNDEKRVRKCNIYYYPENGTLMIVEKPIPNSGLPQGRLVKRAIVLKQDCTPFTNKDLHVGAIIEIYTRIYHIVDCDKSTRQYQYNKLGYTEAAAMEVPEDPYLETRRSVEVSSSNNGLKHNSKKNPDKTWMEVLRGNTTDHTTREGFLRFGSKSLKFKCIWDNSENLYGDIVEFCLTYHLSDDMIEIFSTPQPNSGKDQFSRLLKKSKLAKEFNPMADVIVIENYHWTDMVIGLELNVYGRHLRIIDCDSKTRAFYEHYNIPLAEAEIQPVKVEKVYERYIPPHNGIGSEEDTLRSCNSSLIPGPLPAKKVGENKELSFLCSLLSGGIGDGARRFYITFYVTDDTIKITEPPIRNSGFSGGLFLSRRNLFNADGKKYTYEDLFIGCKFQVLKHTFLLLEANESTMFWLEGRHHGMFPKGKVYSVLNKMRKVCLVDANNGILLKKFQSYEETPGCGRVNKEALTAILDSYHLLGNDDKDITEHEILTLMRGSGNKLPTFDYVVLVEQMVRPTDLFA